MSARPWPYLRALGLRQVRAVDRAGSGWLASERFPALRELDLRESGLLEGEATPALLAQLERLDVSIEPRDARYDRDGVNKSGYMYFFRYLRADTAQVSFLFDEVSERLRWLGLAGARMHESHVRQLRGGKRRGARGVGCARMRAGRGRAARAPGVVRV